jgi:mannosyl-oligosaccharide glucosidase
MNYLILRSLHRIVNRSTKISQKHVFVKEIYTKLRNNLIMNTYNNWKKTGCFYEQYNAKNGHGQRLSDFHGWTTLMVLVLSEKY